jgi:hypothetical protein
MVTGTGTWRMMAVITALGLTGTVIACTGQTPASLANSVANAPARSVSWTDPTHGNDAKPD